MRVARYLQVGFYFRLIRATIKRWKSVCITCGQHKKSVDNKNCPLFYSHFTHKLSTENYELYTLTNGHFFNIFPFKYGIWLYNAWTARSQTARSISWIYSQPLASSIASIKRSRVTNVFLVGWNSLLTN